MLRCIVATDARFAQLASATKMTVSDKTATAKVVLLLSIIDAAVITHGRSFLNEVWLGDEKDMITSLSEHVTGDFHTADEYIDPIFQSLSGNNKSEKDFHFTELGNNISKYLTDAAKSKLDYKEILTSVQQILLLNW